MPGSESIHTYNSDNPGTNPDILRVDTSPHGVEIPTPLADFPIGHGSYVKPAPSRENIGSHLRSKGRSTSLKLPSTGEANRASSGRHHPARFQSRSLIADWFELDSAVLGG